MSCRRSSSSTYVEVYKNLGNEGSDERRAERLERLSSRLSRNFGPPARLSNDSDADGPSAWGSRSGHLPPLGVEVQQLRESVNTGLRDINLRLDSLGEILADLRQKLVPDGNAVS